MCQMASWTHGANRERHSLTSKQIVSKDTGKQYDVFYASVCVTIPHPDSVSNSYSGFVWRGKGGVPIGSEKKMSIIDKENKHLARSMNRGMSELVQCHRQSNNAVTSKSIEIY